MMHYHMIGIGGIGMSGLALLALSKGYTVSGSDVTASSITRDLQNKGATIFIGHKAEQVPSHATVVFTSGITLDNPEFLQAHSQGCRIRHRSEALCDLMKGQKPLCVAGTHGKTTTTSLLTHVLTHAGLDPSYAIGGILKSVGAQAGYGTGQWFVLEADESDGSFLSYHPEGAILTNINLDHMSYWKTEQALMKGFCAFSESIKDARLRIFCIDDPRIASLSLQGVSYGFSEQAMMRILHINSDGWHTDCLMLYREKEFSLRLPLIGRHNCLNAAGVCALGIQLGLDVKTLQEAFCSFQGAKRRAEKKGEACGVLFYDDYAHHPVEIATTLQGFRDAAMRRLVVVFQPHRYTRVRDCFHDFAKALSLADLLVMTDIYSAGESLLPDISTEALHREIQKTKACHLVSRSKLVEEILSIIKEGDLVVTLGAGDVTRVGDECLRRFLP